MPMPLADCRGERAVKPDRREWLDSSLTSAKVLGVIGVGGILHEIPLPHLFQKGSWGTVTQRLVRSFVIIELEPVIQP